MVVAVIGGIAFARRVPGGRTGGGAGLAGPMMGGCFFTFGAAAFVDTVVLCDPARRTAKHLVATTASLIATRSLGFGWYALTAVVPAVEERQGVGNG